MCDKKEKKLTSKDLINLMCDALIDDIDWANYNVPSYLKDKNRGK